LPFRFPVGKRPPEPPRRVSTTFIPVDLRAADDLDRRAVEPEFD
jgi:hypothetical protein